MQSIYKEKIKESLIEIRDFFKDERVLVANRLKSKIIEFLRNFMQRREFVELLPVVASPITDPLSSPETTISFEVYGYPLQLTKSMIFHKQFAMLAFERIYIFSPNFRIEKEEMWKSGRHLVEFTQLDLEVREASREDVMELAEQMLIEVIKRALDEAKYELRFFKRKLRIPERPFKTITYQKAYSKYGPEFETKLSKDIESPIWLLDFPERNREFYYIQGKNPEYLKDFDLIYPEGFGEAISGGEREWRPEKTRERLRRKGIDEDFYFPYLTMLEQGIPPSAGFGIGVERLTRFIAGLDSVKYCRLFPKLPGKFGL